MIHFEWLLFLQIAMGILMIIFLQKQRKIEKQIDGIVREVEGYISYVTNEEQELDKKTVLDSQVVSLQNKKKKDEEETRLIQAVLGEYFP